VAAREELRDRRRGSAGVIDFDGQTVVVTGAGRGLGRAYALELAARGATVVVNDVAGADDVVAEIAGRGGRAVASPESVATVHGARRIVETALDVGGAVDAIVGNAGFLRNGWFEELAPEQVDAVLDVHLKGQFFVCQAAWRAMKERRYGRVVLTGSSAGAFGSQATANYAAAKGGVLGLTRALAYEGAEHGIRVNCVLPMAVTDIGRDNPIPGWNERFLAAVGREGARTFRTYGDPARAAPLVAYLASRDCDVSGEAFSAVCGRYARVFTAVTAGWTAPGTQVVTAEDIAAHLDEIRDPGEHVTPGSLFDEAADALRRVAAAANE
jgi:NAD(P)-dependent dehydrogenase (short-subunit alcohol dehydrogenase family)